MTSLKIPKANGFFSCFCPQTKPSMAISDLILAAKASKSVSSSNGLTSKVIIDLAATTPFLAAFSAFRALYSATRWLSKLQQQLWLLRLRHRNHQRNPYRHHLRLHHR